MASQLLWRTVLNYAYGWTIMDKETMVIVAIGRGEMIWEDIGLIDLKRIEWIGLIRLVQVRREDLKLFRWTRSWVRTAYSRRKGGRVGRREGKYSGSFWMSWGTGEGYLGLIGVV